MSIVIIYPTKPEICNKVYDALKEFVHAEELPLDIFEKKALVKLAKEAIELYENACLNPK